MSVATFPNGQPALASSALTPEGIQTLFQPLICAILGFPTPGFPGVVGPVSAAQADAAWYAVRCGWQKTGQPFQKITEDVCYILASISKDPFSRVRDELLTQNDPVSLGRQMTFTRVWNMHFTLYGPNSEDHARLIVSAIAALDWVQAYLANPPAPVTSNIYPISTWVEPEYHPENLNDQWWPRTDVDMRFNEKVNETTTVVAADSAEIIITPDIGCPETVMPSVVVKQPGTFQRIKSFTQIFTNATSVTANHNFNSFSVVVNVWSTSGQQITPQSVDNSSPDSVVVNFSVPLSGIVVVQGVVIGPC